MIVMYWFGKKYGNVDLFFCIFCNKLCFDMNVDIDFICIYCGGCRYSVRVYWNWFNFIYDVGVVILFNRKKYDVVVIVV